MVAEELGSSKEVVHIKLNARKLDKKDFFGKSDPYIIISKFMEDGTWMNVHKTEIIKNTLNPDWRPFSVRVASLTGDSHDRKLRFQCFDWDSDGSSDFIGEFEITYGELLSGELTFTLTKNNWIFLFIKTKFQIEIESFLQPPKRIEPFIHYLTHRRRQRRSLTQVLEH